MFEKIDYVYEKIKESDIHKQSLRMVLDDASKEIEKVGE
jgi:hypothetical protein